MCISFYPVLNLGDYAVVCLNPQGPHVYMDRFLEHMINLQLPSGESGKVLCLKLHSGWLTPVNCVSCENNNNLVEQS